ncbi:Salmonella virulence plasmid 65kDa B protein [uncultured archaeon]|nr:Salmonella virulence plasmid 65kDa B protein [uncultured archaeon]
MADEVKAPKNIKENADKKDSLSQGSLSMPSISLPKGGGAIRGIGEKFGINPVTGTGSLSIPIFASQGRSNFGPQLSLSYDSGSGNGPFGFGWSLSLPSISRKTDKGLPRYQDANESDIFILSGAEDLVPVFKKGPDGNWIHDSNNDLEFDEEHRDGYLVRHYRPRIEGLFARIERWTREFDGDVHWRSISKDNILTVYGRDQQSRIFDPSDKSRIFSWLICESYDDKGNAIVYEYAAENEKGIDLSLANECHRERTANRYLRRILYGNTKPLLLDITKPGFRKLHTEQIDFSAEGWMFELVFDYGEGHYALMPLDETKSEKEQHRFVQASSPTPATWIWAVRSDPFSSYRAGFEVRAYRRCQRVLMFHRFRELGDEPYLVRSTEFDYRDLDYSEPVDVENELSHKGSTRFASFIRVITQSGYVRDESKPVLEKDGAKYITYIKKSLPPLEFDYSQAIIQEEIKDIDSVSLENLPYGLEGTSYQWVDLDGEGISGILTQQAGAWFYKPNTGDGKFDPMVSVFTKPSLSDISSGRQQLIDLAGDGQLDLVITEGPVQGFYERTEDQGWNNFIPFSSIPNVSWKDPNLKFIDLTGDGHADIIITNDEVFTWYPSLAEEGFGAAEMVRKALDEEKGPRLIFNDGTQSIYLADMSGDGLTDIVRITNGEVCYWPNLGYGRFGAKVIMDGSPWFDSVDQFNQKRIHLADIDGSGTTDIIYIGRDGTCIYFNQSGNRLSKPRQLRQFPPVDDLSSVMAVDLFGNGTACLVWSSPLPAASRRPMRYIDLMGGQKPHLLIKSVNNLGAETVVQYASSTKFYLADKLTDKPWITKIPFPVYVVERVETYDRISRNRFVTRYAYHHGYFDGIEREFRGFGMVEQWDTENFAALTSSDAFPTGDNIDAASHVPPVYTKTWFHTGAYIDRNRISNYFAGLIDENDLGEYYREPAWSSNDDEARKRLLDDTVLPKEELTIDEEREACRSLKGTMLRQEVYALDGSEKEPHPYTITEQNFTIQLLQPQAGNPHAVFFTHPREAISYHYERDPNDPRTTHSLTLDVDDFGNVQRSMEVGYPRRDVPERQPEQNETHLTLTLNRFANRDDMPDWRRIGVPVEARTYEVAKPPATTLRFSWDELHDLILALVPADKDEPPLTNTIPYEQWDWRRHWNPQTEPGRLINSQLRLIEHVRTLYRPNDLGVSRNNALALLTLGVVESLALPGESYRLAFTPDLVKEVYGGRVTEAMLETEGRYVHSEGDTNWWIPSGRIFYSPGSTDTSAQELGYASQHFFLPNRYRDPFHTDALSTESFVDYDANDLLVQETRDALGNLITVGERKPNGDIDPDKPGNDYRVLQPRLETDPNRNRTVVAFDALGMVVGTAVMGKPEDNPQHGDLLDKTFRPDLTQDEIDKFLANPKGPMAETLLDKATTRIIYDLTAYWLEPDLDKKPPAFAATLARETHFSDPVPASGLKIQASLSYSDGFGREIQKKIQAEPGPIEESGPNIEMRWVGSGWTIFNNKGKPVRQYEPCFDDTHEFKFGKKVGVSSTLFYDPAERVIATIHPNNTYEKVVFDSWHQKTYDVNDTVALDPRTDEDIRGYVAEYFKEEPQLPEDWKTWLGERGVDPLNPPQDTPGLDPEKKAAVRTLIHADTPTIAHFDTLGRTFLTVAHNKFRRSSNGCFPNDSFIVTEEKYPTKLILDIEGNQREVVDVKLDPASQKGRIVMRYDYDILSNRIHQMSMEAGERWMLNDVSGKPIRAWDSRDHHFHNAYDSLRRPTETYLQEGPEAELLVGRTVYGDSKPSPLANPEAKNLRGKVYQVFDQAGIVTSDEYDFKGNLLSSRRQLGADYKNTLNWSPMVEPVKFEDEIFTSSTTYDALNRPIQIIAPHSDRPDAKTNTIHLTYNEASLLENIEANLQGETEATPFVKDMDYNAKGQRLKIVYDSGASEDRHRQGVTTSYTYDQLTFRLTDLLTYRNAEAFPDDCPKPPTEGWPGCQLQNLHYTYDPAGNIIYIRDDAQQTIFFSQHRVEPSTEYTYDAIYRLIEAKGREHLGQVGGAPQPHSHNDWPRVGKDWSANNGYLMGTYWEGFDYDEVGNILAVQHKGCNPSNPGWTRSYSYDEDSLIEPGRVSNRLSSTTISGSSSAVEKYQHDGHGNMIYMPHLAKSPDDYTTNMHWDYRDQLQQADLGVGGTAYYVYDSNGQRIRKVCVKSPGLTEERIYLGGFEVFRRYNGDGAVTLERETLHMMDDKQRIALVETRTLGEDPAPGQLIRYQFGNHLGSASLELDDQAQIISYEEYYPYGSTSYQAMGNNTETPKRYRYTGKERDEETGLYYHGARHYTPWLGRWIAADPIGLADGADLFVYASGNPIGFKDPGGTQKEMVCYTDEQHATVNCYPVIEVEIHGKPKNEQQSAPPAIDLSSTLEELDKDQNQNQQNKSESSTPFSENPLVQIGLGLILGGFQGWIPGGVLANAIPTPTRYTEMGRAVSEGLMGVAQMGIGTFGAGGGGLLCFTGIGSIFGAPVAISGAVVFAQGATNVVGSTIALSKALSMPSTSSSPKDSNSSSSSPSKGPRSVKEANDISEANRNTVKQKAPELVRRYNREKDLIEAEDRFAEFSKDELYPHGVNDVNIGALRGSRAKDFAAANKIAGYSETPKGYTWHHHQDLGRIQLVEESVHAKRVEGHDHWGGVSIWQKVFNMIYGQ